MFHERCRNEYNDAMHFLQLGIFEKYSCAMRAESLIAGMMIPPEVIKMLRTTVYFNSPVQICEHGLLEPLECMFGVSLQ